jgi:hypothetical protein
VQHPNLVYVSTRESLGYGFMLHGYDYLICPEKVIRASHNPTILSNGKRLKSKVVYIDESIHLALVKTKEPVDLLPLLPSMQDIDSLSLPVSIDPLDGAPIFVDDSVKAIAHHQRRFSGYQLECIGIEKVLKAIQAFQNSNSTIAIKCTTCDQIVTNESQHNQQCSSCGLDLSIFKQQDTNDKSPITYKIETIIKKAGYRVELTRRGAGKWHIANDEGLTEVSYHDRTGAIIMESTVKKCSFFNQEIEDYLLKQNFHNKSLSLSISNNQVVLSSVKYDQYLDLDKMAESLSKFVKAAQRYQEILHSFTN